MLSAYYNLSIEVSNDFPPAHLPIFIARLPKRIGFSSIRVRARQSSRLPFRRSKARVSYGLRRRNRRNIRHQELERHHGVRTQCDWSEPRRLERKLSRRVRIGLQ